jgi:regulator of RNase E activity RraA
MIALTPAIHAALIAVDTPTICNALEAITGSRTTEGFTQTPVVCARPEMPAVVGYARTAVIRCSAPSTTPAPELRQRRLAYYGHMASGDGPRIAVIEDRDERAGLGAFWGEVNVAIHKGLGLAGVLTNGSIRDLGAIDDGFQLLAGSVMPSHAFVHVESFGEPVTVFGLPIAHDDLIHMDRHGAVRIPHEMLAALPAAIDLVTRKEQPMLAAARAPGFTVEKLITAWGQAEDIH